jgi:hypothetical protein
MRRLFAFSDIPQPAATPQAQLSDRLNAASAFPFHTADIGFAPPFRSPLREGSAVGRFCPKRPTFRNGAGNCLPLPPAASGAELAPPKRRRRTMTEHFAGLDVSVETLAVCLVDAAGEPVLRTSVATEPDAIAQALGPFSATLRRAGHEAGSLSPWLQVGLRRCGVPAICLETRHVRAALSAQRNKTDATDALGLAHIVRTGWYRTAHVTTPRT